MTCNLLPDLTRATKLVLVKCDVFQAGDASSLVGLLEVAHANVSNSSMPKTPKRGLDEEACHLACIFCKEVHQVYVHVPKTLEHQ